MIIVCPILSNSTLILLSVSTIYYYLCLRLVSQVEPYGGDAIAHGTVSYMYCLQNEWPFCISVYKQGFFARVSVYPDKERTGIL